MVDRSEGDGERLEVNRAEQQWQWIIQGSVKEGFLALASIPAAQTIEEELADGMACSRDSRGAQPLRLAAQWLILETDW